MASPYAACRKTAAMRHGSRTAASPPGIGDLLEVARALEPVQIRQRGTRRPTRARRCRSRCRPRRRRSRGRRPRCRPGSSRCGRGDAGRQRARTPSSDRGVGRRAIAGMEIVGDDAGRELEQALEVGDRVRPGPVCALIAKIAEVLAEEHLAAADQRERALELPATGQDRLGRRRGSARSRAARSRARGAGRPGRRRRRAPPSRRSAPRSAGREPGRDRRRPSSRVRASSSW